MEQVLLVRMSSLGDIVHTFPVATDLARERPGIALDWVVEEAYVPLAAMHPGVRRVIPVALRRWRKEFLGLQAWRELRAFRRGLREARYDLVLDTQGLLKSAWVARAARAPIHGFGPGTAREPLASRSYARCHEFQPSDHKIERYREVAARALGYSRPAGIDYGIVAPPRPPFAPPGDYCVLLHSTAREAKLWPEARWIELCRALEARGLACVLPWGSESEQARSERLAGALQRSVVPPRLSIPDAAGLLAGARAVAGVDTGLMHLAAALRVPAVGIFCDSEPLDARPVGPGPTAYRGAIGRPPSADEVLEAVREVAPALFGRGAGA